MWQKKSLAHCRQLRSAEEKSGNMRYTCVTRAKASMHSQRRILDLDPVWKDRSYVSILSGRDGLLALCRYVGFLARFEQEVKSGRSATSTTEWS